MLAFGMRFATAPGERRFIMWRGTLLFVLLLATAIPIGATTYVVHPDGSGDFPTIQAAVDAAVNGDIIELTDGTFAGDGNWNVDFQGKAITVRSQSGNPQAVRILCDVTRAFIFQSGEGPASVLESITIANGYNGSVLCRQEAAPTISNCIFDHDLTEGDGGGMVCQEASPTVIDCLFNTCFAFGSGGAIFCQGESFPTITGCTFQGNIAAYDYGSGGAISCGGDSYATIANCRFIGNESYTGFGGAFGGNGTISNCEFVGNSAQIGGGAVSCRDATISGCVFRCNSGGRGGAIRCAYDSTPLLRCCTVFDNDAWEVGSGIRCEYGSALSVENCIIAFGTGDVAVDCGDDATVLLTCCDIYGNAEGDWVGCIEDQLGIDGNICEDPLFCDQYACPPDLTLQECSPCRPFSPPNPECDLIGALPVGCGGTPVTESTWGALKYQFR
jgi:hypothetical protein